MSAVQYPLVNGVRQSWPSVEIKLAGFIFYAVEINYSRTRERTVVYVNHPDPVGKTRGKNTYVGDCTLLLAEWNNFHNALILQAGVQGLGYGDVPFEVISSYTEIGLDTITDTLKGCTLDSLESAGAEGTDPLKRKFNLAPLKILFNGADDIGPIPGPLAAPPTS